MLKFGEAPYLECSSKGDKRFSAFYAKIKYQGARKSIEEIYQSTKMFGEGVTNLSIKSAKGRKPLNIEFCRKVYTLCWRVYFKQNPELLEVIKKYKGMSDIFGQEGHVCQAEEIYQIWLNPEILKSLSSTDIRMPPQGPTELTDAFK